MSVGKIKYNKDNELYFKKANFTFSIHVVYGKRQTGLDKTF